jgi:hypothetical protein
MLPISSEHFVLSSSFQKNVGVMCFWVHTCACMRAHTHVHIFFTVMYELKICLILGEEQGWGLLSKIII